MGWTMEETYRGIELLDTRADVLSVSEFDKEFTRGGVTSRIIDYSISVVGPSEYTVNCLNKARETGTESGQRCRSTTVGSVPPCRICPCSTL